MPCSAYLSGGLISNKQGVGFFQILQKDRLFDLLRQPNALGGNLIMWLSFWHLPKKGLPLLFSLAKTRIYVDTQLKGELTDLL